MSRDETRRHAGHELAVVVEYCACLSYRHPGGRANRLAEEPMASNIRLAGRSCRCPDLAEGPLDVARPARSSSALTLPLPSSRKRSASTLDICLAAFFGLAMTCGSAATAVMVSVGVRRWPEQDLRAAGPMRRPTWTRRGSRAGVAATDDHDALAGGRDRLVVAPALVGRRQELHRRGHAAHVAPGTAGRATLVARHQRARRRRWKPAGRRCRTPSPTVAFVRNTVPLATSARGRRSRWRFSDSNSGTP